MNTALAWGITLLAPFVLFYTGCAVFMGIRRIWVNPKGILTSIASGAKEAAPWLAGAVAAAGVIMLLIGVGIAIDRADERNNRENCDEMWPRDEEARYACYMHEDVQMPPHALTHIHEG